MIDNKKITLKMEKKARAKKDEGPRNHKCNCGKGYMSFSALYTHIKQKHSLDEMPKWYDTNRNILEKPCGKGRPHKYYDKSDIKADESQKDENYLIKIYENAKSIQLIMEIAKEFKEFILKMTEPRIKKEEYLETLLKVSTDIVEVDNITISYLRENAGSNEKIFQSFSPDYGLTNWRLLMIHNHLRTIFKPKVFTFVIYVSILASLGKQIDEIINDPRLPKLKELQNSSKSGSLITKIFKLVQFVMDELQLNEIF